jgi:hypothetical protein
MHSLGHSGSQIGTKRQTVHAYAETGHPRAVVDIAPMEACDSTLACMAAGTATSASPEQISGLLQQQRLQQQQLQRLRAQLSALRGDNLSFQDLLYGAWDGFDMTSRMFDPNYVPPRSTGAQMAATLGLATGGGTRLLTPQEIVRLHAAGAVGGST